MAAIEPAISADMLELALRASKGGGWVWDAASDKLAWDQHGYGIAGEWPAPPTGASFLAAIHPADRGDWRRRWRVALAPGGNGIFDCRFRLIRPSDGATRWIAAVGRAEMAGKRVVRMTGVMRDLSDEARTIETRDVLASQLAGIVSIAVDAIIAMDDRQIVTLFSDGAEAIFGYPRSEVIGQPLAMLLPEAVRTAHAEHVHKFGAASVDASRARRMGERGEIAGRRKTGEIFPAEASISRIEVNGRPHYTAVLRDVTERRQSQAELERRVEESTRELRLEMRRREESQAQLVRTQRMEAFGQLTGGVAHDFNNLLTVITGNLELLDMRLEDEKSKALLQRAQDAAGMGARLTARLLTFARRRQLAAAPLNVNDLVINLAELLERTIGEPITLTTSLERTPWTVLADPSEIENAILNLAINARDAMPEGGKLIIETANVTLEANDGGGASEAPPKAGPFVRLSVSDTGHGMTEEVLRHAFEPFYTTKETGKGTGLGLSTVYGFAQQAGGTLTIYSEIGHGTTVNLYLPRAQEATDSAPHCSNPDEVLPGSGEHVLLVEDNPDVRLVTQNQLEALGYQVTAAPDGPAAVGALSAPGQFDLVLSDVVMPGGMSGFDLAAWVKSHRPEIQIILASGYAEGVLPTPVGDESPQAILRKPFSRAELARILRRTLDAVTDERGAPQTLPTSAANT
jgi:PAS domain S-box-containing protein